MLRSARVRVGTFAVSIVCVTTAGSAFLATPAHAAPASRCVSMNGTLIVQTGTAQCETDESTTSKPNIAIATGENSFARATLGNGNTAIAIGSNSQATVDTGDGNWVTATGYGAIAGGSGNRNL